MPVEFKNVSESDLLDMGMRLVQPKRQMLISPQHGFCVHSTLRVLRDYKETELQLYINICWSDSVDNAKTKMLHSCCHNHNHNHKHDIKDKTGIMKKGEHHWMIPYILHRSYKDERQKIYDFVVGFKTYKRVKRDSRFRDLVIQTAMESIEEKFGDSIVKDKAMILNGKKYMEAVSRLPVRQRKVVPRVVEINDSLTRLESNKEIRAIRLDGIQKLTDSQRCLIESLLLMHCPVPILNIPTIQLDIPLCEEHKLKMMIPECHIHQTTEYVTYIFNGKDMDTDSLNIYVRSMEETHDMEIHYMTKDYKEFAWYNKLPDGINVSLSYATYSIEAPWKLVVVLKKAESMLWEYPLLRQELGRES